MTRLSITVIRRVLRSSTVPPRVLTLRGAVPRYTGRHLVTSVVVGVLAVAALTFTVAFLSALDDAATMTSRLHLGAGETSLYALLSASFLPNAAIVTGSWLLGPGFAVGAGTLVSPAAVVLGPLPLFPLLAALPDAGTPAGWTGTLMGLPPLVAALAAVRVLRRRVLSWDHLLLAAGGGGIVAGVVLAVLASVSGGAAGPGRMRHVGPSSPDVLVHAVTACGIGTLVGALLLLGWRWYGARRDGSQDG